MRRNGIGTKAPEEISDRLFPLAMSRTDTAGFVPLPAGNWLTGIVPAAGGVRERYCNGESYAYYHQQFINDTNL